MDQDMEELLAGVRKAALERGSAWLREQLGSALEPVRGSGRPVRRTRPPRRLSPGEEERPSDVRGAASGAGPGRSTGVSQDGGRDSERRRRRPPRTAGSGRQATEGRSGGGEDRGRSPGRDPARSPDGGSGGRSGRRRSSRVRPPGPSGGLDRVSSGAESPDPEAGRKRSRMDDRVQPGLRPTRAGRSGSAAVRSQRAVEDRRQPDLQPGNAASVAATPQVPSTSAQDSTAQRFGAAGGSVVGSVSAGGSWGGRRGLPVPGGDVAARDRLLAGWVRSSLAPATWAAYDKVWQEWDRLVSCVGLVEGDGARLDVLLWYLTGLALEGASPSKVDRVLAALAFLFKLQGWADVTKHFVVRQVLKGIKRGRRVPDARRPLSAGLLRRLFGVLGGVCFDGFEVLLFQAAFALAFFGAFRVSELVSPNKSVQGGLASRDVMCEGDSVVIWLRSSKTDVLGRGKQVRLYALPGDVICPVQCVQHYWDVRPAGGVSFLVHRDLSPVSRFQFLRVMRLGLGKLGLASAEFGTHSFRIGAATEAARLGLDDGVIRRIGPRFIVWIIGHSFVYWAQRRAAVRRNGLQLGFPMDLVHVRWFGIRGMVWDGVLLEVVKYLRLGFRPSVVVIHAGGNDMGATPQRELVWKMRRDVERLLELVPGLLLVWSEMIPRRNWRHARDRAAMEHSRGKVNKLMASFVRRHGGVVVRHVALEEFCPSLFSGDGVHLSDLGLDFFNLALTEGIEKALFFLGGGAHPA
ncbi:uncharacterized protein LOC128484031 [Spea bombifrons]|uniref:uncharacterized protein LOC128484031 n=1 Tax=Spea bombifrons TaxID=233779 RepID=UPI00234A634C|nr:uncharacterized protein LOC128484031 [Spea bombifrons]